MFAVVILSISCAKPNIKPAIPKPASLKPTLSSSEVKDCNCNAVQNAAIQVKPIQVTPGNKTPELAHVDKANVADYSLLKPAKWEELDGLLEDELTAAWSAWLQSCSTLMKQEVIKPAMIKPALLKQALLNPASLKPVQFNLTSDKKTAANSMLAVKPVNNKPQWQAACAAAINLKTPNNAAIIAYLTDQFDVYSATNQDGSDTGLITGYYEPILKGSRKQSSQYPYPLYREPADLITVELATIHPDLKFKRLRGRLANDQLINQKEFDQEANNLRSSSQKLIPYLTRAEIETNPSPLAGNELVWIDDIIDIFFLQIQGSGLVNLEVGGQVHVGYANQNGHAYNSIGKLLIQRGELNSDQASMQGIKNWARNHTAQLRDLLNANPSYVFFRELPAGLSGPLGAQGVPITAQRSTAIDPKYVPLGALMFLSTTQPNSATPLKRLMVAQDTGGAIKGGVRADYFWGAGENAGAKAGAMKQQGKIWVFLPKNFMINH